MFIKRVSPKYNSHPHQAALLLESKPSMVAAIWGHIISHLIKPIIISNLLMKKQLQTPRPQE
jgi:hypothetical protein